MKITTQGFGCQPVRAGVWIALFLNACSTSGMDAEDTGEASSDAAPTETATNDGLTTDGGGQCTGRRDGEPIVLTDAMNYTFSSTVSIEHTVLKDATDLRFDWSNLTRDFFGRDMDAAEDIDLVLVSLWNMTPTELEESIRVDTLPFSANKGVITTYPDGTYTSQNLLAFDILGTEVEEDDLWAFFDTSNPMFQFPQDSHTFMVTASTGTELRRGARMLSFFTLDSASENTEFVLRNESMTLDYEAHIADIEPLLIPAADPSIALDWGDMTTNALGNPFQPQQITEAVIAHFDDLTPAMLEDRFIDLESLADGWWSTDQISGTSIELGALSDTDGAAFEGVNGEGLWLLALFCTASCNNPAPWALMILQPC